MENKPARQPLVAVVVVIFTVRDNRLEVLLIKRSADPQKGRWALPGGLLLEGEGLDAAASRKLVEETGVHDVYLEQLYTFADLDPAAVEGSVAVSYFALVDASVARLAPREEWLPGWHSLDDRPDLAFSNDLILDYALERLRNKLQYSNVAYGLMPPEFSLGQLQRTYESILGPGLDKRNFRRKVLSLDIIEETGKVRTEGAHRPAKLYRFVRREPVTF
ncbi:MAG TPA: NUDIX domain-containing protein [Dehalococcoidia bacterium]|nr:NUDIX domain-containing protein [Dehalococcoidia bacterium]